jgi:hypothetical protein
MKLQAILLTLLIGTANAVTDPLIGLLAQLEKDMETTAQQVTPEIASKISSEAKMRYATMFFESYRNLFPNENLSDFLATPKQKGCQISAKQNNSTLLKFHHEPNKLFEFSVYDETNLNELSGLVSFSLAKRVKEKVPCMPCNFSSKGNIGIAECPFKFDLTKEEDVNFLRDAWLSNQEKTAILLVSAHISEAAKQQSLKEQK